MVHTRNFLACVIAGAVLTAFSSTAHAQRHMDKWATLHIIRQVEEQNDALQDRIDDWAAGHQEEMRHSHADLFRSIDQFTDDLDDLKAQVRQHDEPWDTRDKVQSVVQDATEMGHAIQHSDFPPEVRQQWRQVRNGVDQLAQQYHLPPVSW